MASASIASAHHCYKVDWNDAAYEHVSSGTAWWTLNDLGAMTPPPARGRPRGAPGAAARAVPRAAWGAPPGAGGGPTLPGQGRTGSSDVGGSTSTWVPSKWTRLSHIVRPGTSEPIASGAHAW